MILVGPARNAPPRHDLDHTDLAACSGGDQDAFERIYHRHVSACLTVARGILRDEQLARVTVQEAFLQLWQGAPDIDPQHSSVGAWLALLTRRRALDQVRRRSRPQVSDVQEDGPGRCLVLAFWGGHSLSEISQITGIPIGTVKTRLRQALQLLRKELAADTANRPLHALASDPARLTL